MPGGNCSAATEAACASFPAVDPGGTSTYGDTFIPLLGVISEVDANYNYDRDGNVLPLGAPVVRRYATDEYEMFAQDSWKIGAEPHRHRRSALQPLLAAVGSQRPAGGPRHLARQLVRAAAGADARRPLDQRSAGGALRSRRPGQQQAWLLQVGQEQLRAARGGGVVAAGRRRTVRLADRQRQDGHPRRLLDRVRPHRHGSRDELRQGRRLRVIHRAEQPVRRTQRRRSGHPVRRARRDSADAARSASRRIPADAALVRRHHHRGARRQHPDAVRALVQRRGRTRAGPWVLDRGRLRRPPRTQSARASRRGHAGRRRGLEVGRGLLHRRGAADQRGKGDPEDRRSGRLQSHHAHPVLGEPVPGRGAGRAHRHAAHGGRVQRARSRLHHAALQRGRGLLPGMQHARRVRVLRAAVRHARHAEHHRAVAVRCAAGVGAQAVQRGLPVRPELHVRVREGSRIAASKTTRRSRCSATEATRAS